MTRKGSVQASGSESGSEADTESQAGGDSGGEEGKGSGSEGEGSGSEGEAEDDDSQQGDSSDEIVEVSGSEAEVSGSESSSSSSESEVEVKKAHPNRKTVENDPNTSQSISLPELDSKDSEEERKTNCHGFAHHMDVDFSLWRDRKISEGLKQLDEWDKMTCDLTEPGKEAKYPDPLGTPLDYIESHQVFKPIKTSEYDLCHFYQVGLSGDFPEFPKPHEPATNDHMHSFLERAWEFSRPNLIVAHSQDVVSVVCLLWELHANTSL